MSTKHNKLESESEMRYRPPVAPAFDDRTKPAPKEIAARHCEELVARNTREMLFHGASSDEIKTAAEADKFMHNLLFERIGLPIPEFRSLDESLAPRNDDDDKIAKNYIFSDDTMQPEKLARAKYLEANFQHWRDFLMDLRRELFRDERKDVIG